MRLQEFVDVFGDMEPGEFLARFDHPFLLESSEDLPEGQDRRIFLVRGVEGKPLVVGRGGHCHIPIRDELVSTKHAVLYPPDETPFWTLQDQGSTNRTLLDDVPLPPNEPTPLSNQARISFGPASHFTFVLTETLLEQIETLGLPSKEGREHWGTATDRIKKLSAEELKEARKLGDTPVDNDTKVIPPSALPPVAPVTELLLFATGLDPLPLEIGDTILIGRKGQNVDLILNNGEVSRRHAEIQRRPDGIYVRDLGTTNGTFIGALRLDTTWQRLSLGRRLTIEPFELHVGEPQPSTGAGKRDHPTDRADRLLDDDEASA